MPQTFFHNSPYLQKYVLIRLILYHWQLLQFCDITKDILQISTGSLGQQVSVAEA